jgi:hypothetical protein
MENEENATSKSEKMSLLNSILSTSSSMLGFCFVIISYLHASGFSGKTIVDELVMASMVAFMFNCLLSFLSVRSIKFQTQRYINLTSGIYISGMIILFGIVVLITLGLID